MASIEMKSLEDFLNDVKEKIIASNELVNSSIEKVKNRFEEILSEEISNLTIRSNFMQGFKDKITISSNEFTVEVGFKKNVRRRSIFYDFTGTEVYMPYITNNPWKRTLPRSFRFKKRNKIYFTSRNYKEENRHFMNRAIDRFNSEYADFGIIAEANKNYQ